MKFAIPSKGRSELVRKTLDVIGCENTEVYVAVEEAESYELLIKGRVPVKTLPEGTYGMGAIRKHILEVNRGEDCIVMWDDDIKGLVYKWTDGDFTPINSTQHIRAVMENLRQTAEDLETPLFTVSPSTSAQQYNQFHHFQFGGMASTILGIIPRFLGDADFDPRFIISEDHDFSLNVKYFRRYLLMDNRYGVVNQKTWLRRGGCSTLRWGEDLFKQRTELLRRKYGDLVRANQKGKPRQISIYAGF